MKLTSTILSNTDVYKQHRGRSAHLFNKGVGFHIALLALLKRVVANPSLWAKALLCFIGPEGSVSMRSEKVKDH